jgi:hypothetical protein
MSIYSANTCNIITLLPLGVDCTVVNAYNPLTSDGAVYLTITGGTPPYKIKWNNGSTNQAIVGVQQGTYTANVTDYYGDFSATTTCTVGTNSFYLEEFFDCTNPTNKLYYKANLNLQYPSGDTFTLVSQQGCWVSNGLKSYSGQTYFNFTASTTSGPFEDCATCLPQTPQPENTSKLCLTTVAPPASFNQINQPTLEPIFAQYQFFSAGTFNGYPSWTSSTPTQKIFFNTATNSWNVTGWTFLGFPVLQQQISPPLGIWTLNGGNRTINVTQGDCTALINANIQKVNPTCSSASNGVIKVNSVIGGTAPYTYSINNITYQNSNTFNNLLSGTYTVYTKDVIGNVGTKLVTLSPSQQVINYQVILELIPPNPVTPFSSVYAEKTATWRVSVTPTLPANRSINFTVYNTTQISGGTGDAGGPTFSYSNTTGTTGTSQYLTSTIQTVTNSYPNTVLCHPNFYTTGITRTYNVSLSGTGSIGGTIYQKVTIANSTGCYITGSIKDTISLGNIVLNNQQTCETISTIVTPINMTTGKSGQISTVSQNQSE